MSNHHTKNNSISEEEKALFRDAVKGSKPLHHDKVIHNKPYLSKRPKCDSESISSPEVDWSLPEENVSGEQSLQFYHPGIQFKIMKKLKKGIYPPQDVFDLHGKTRAEASIAIQKFLQFSQQQHYKCVLIIHGKGHSSQEGKAILKNHLNRWLKKHPAVLAFCSALPQHGGNGAVYVLLKK